MGGGGGGKRGRRRRRWRGEDENEYIGITALSFLAQCFLEVKCLQILSEYLPTRSG